MSYQKIQTCHIRIGLIRNSIVVNPDLVFRSLPNPDELRLGITLSVDLWNFFYFFITILENHLVDHYRRKFSF